jgi:ATP-dependent DNA helicase RecQ
MQGARPARIELPARGSAGARREGRDAVRPLGEPAAAPRRERSPGVGPGELGADDRALWDALRAQRMAFARASGVPPYVVAHDRTLAEIVRWKPRTPTELLQIYGMGPARLARYGEALLEVVRGRCSV